MHIFLPMLNDYASGVSILQRIRLIKSQHPVFQIISVFGNKLLRTFSSFFMQEICLWFFFVILMIHSVYWKSFIQFDLLVIFNSANSGTSFTADVWIPNFHLSYMTCNTNLQTRQTIPTYLTISSIKCKMKFLFYVILCLSKKKPWLIIGNNLLLNPL